MILFCCWKNVKNEKNVSQTFILIAIQNIWLYYLIILSYIVMCVM